MCERERREAAVEREKRKSEACARGKCSHTCVRDIEREEEEGNKTTREKRECVREKEESER